MLAARPELTTLLDIEMVLRELRLAVHLIGKPGTPFSLDQWLALRLRRHPTCRGGIPAIRSAPDRIGAQVWRRN